MLALLTFVFSDFAHFVGTVLLVSVILDGIADIVRATRARKVKRAASV
jgi:hypothetical protein